MMVHYSRQEDQDLDERPASPVSEILNDGAGRVTFISPTLKYTVRTSNLLAGRTRLEKILIFCIFLISVVNVICISITFCVSRETNIKMYLTHVDKNSSNLTTPTEMCVTTECVLVAASVLESADFSVDPCTDFYQYACGNWERKNPIPDGKSSWNTFSKLWQDNQRVLKTLLEEPLNQTLEGCEACVKAKMYYQSCLDTNKTLEDLGGEPLLNILESNFYWNITDFDGSGQLDSFNLQEVMQRVQYKFNVNGFFVWNVGADDKNSTFHVLQIDQGGLSLRNREYYLNKTDDDKVLNALHTVMVDLTSMLYKEKRNLSEINHIVLADIQRQMQDVIDLETKMAEITSPSSEQRDEERRYHSYTIEQLQNETDFIEWLTFFQDSLDLAHIKINSSQKIIVYSPLYLRELGSLIKNYSSSVEGKNTLNNYLMWNLMRSYKGALSEKYRNVDKLLEEAMMGASVKEDRWRECVTDTDQVLGFALGAMFINSTFNTQSKPEAESMIQGITSAFIKELHKKDWIDNQTKIEAEKKAKKITNMVGYPEFIKNMTALNKKYEKLDISEDFFANDIRYNTWVMEENLSQLSKEVDRDKWGMTPPTINAYYTPTKNQIVFPAGILQRPFFNLASPRSLNYGAMGVVMGHELSHAFDDQGREYDEDGNMRVWWQNKTLLEYKMRVGCMEEQYGNFTVNGENVNGKQTVGENIADNGGLKAAYEAYLTWIAQNPSAELGSLPGINLNHDQLFFLSFGQVWCSHATPQTEHYNLLEDSHSPPRLRVQGTLSNSQYFAKAYSCPKGSKMNPGEESVCTVW